MSNQNVELLRTAFRAFESGDIEVVLGLEESVCHGHEGIRKLSAVWPESMDDVGLSVYEVRDMHERVLILAELTGRAKDSGAPFRQPFGVVNSDLRDDGAVGEVRFFLTWREALDAVGLSR